MKHLFNYTLKLSCEIYTLVQDITIFQKILDEKKKSLLTKEKLEYTEKELKKKVFYLRILEHISYLDEYKNDIKRAISYLDLFLSKKQYTQGHVKKIGVYLSTICQQYESNANEILPIASNTLQHQLIEKLEVTMKTIEIILLSFYGLSSNIKDIENKLVKTIENLLELDLKNLSPEEKNLLEEFFQHIQDAFNQKSVEAWEKTFIKCNEIMNKLKTLAGIPTSPQLDISGEYIDETDKDGRDNDSKDKKDDDNNKRKDK